MKKSTFLRRGATVTRSRLGRVRQSLPSSDQLRTMGTTAASATVTGLKTAVNRLPEPTAKRRGLGRGRTVLIIAGCAVAAAGATKAAIYLRNRREEHPGPIWDVIAEKVKTRTSSDALKDDSKLKEVADDDRPLGTVASVPPQRSQVADVAAEEHLAGASSSDETGGSEQGSAPDGTTTPERWQ